MTAATDRETARRVCSIHDLEIERGRAALLGCEQIALFLLQDGRVHAVSNFDPYSGANVISRGIVGTKGDTPTVASPMHKQVFDLRTGECVDSLGKPLMHLPVWRVVREGDVISLLPPAVDSQRGRQL